MKLPKRVGIDSPVGVLAPSSVSSTMLLEEGGERRHRYHELEAFGAGRPNDGAR